ncbi:prov protein [Salpingoeca rosetta]|uniref:Prov protein n=1 Tax=Salpingoeca rosetta (strain ATCC 50818 / BSB-021) TaxID=946362 RepID=F2UCK7_SALR5|nr:prov protein [Salpingoeca rosetta]EGD74314.1 prov protein [Salpingoeca rosetta]|eukprot:XP_004993214.1 prov protein [Salpingoeca rosetta]
MGDGASSAKEASKKDMFKYSAPWPVYSLAFSRAKTKPFRLAAGSFIEEYKNKVQILDINEETGDFEVHSQVDHPYPTTKIQWIPDPEETRPELFATTGDYLRLWRVGEGEGGRNRTNLEVILNNNKTSEFCAPLTSFDWHEVDPNFIVTSSIDTTCTVWNITAEKAAGRAMGSVKSQLIAHDQEVYDVAYSNDVNIFTSVSADASVRMFDLRSLDHSTIVYEDEGNQPLLRLACNKQDPNYLAVVKIDDPSVVIIDIRMPCMSLAVLNAHSGACNGAVWAPHSAAHLITVSDDKRTLIWDICNIPMRAPEPILCYEPDGPINQVQWSTVDTSWVGITWGSSIEVLKT